MFTDIQFTILDVVDSTNAFAKRLADIPHANSVHAIIAREQTHGKGRFGKNWTASKDSSILMTLFFQENSLTLPHQFTQILAYTCCIFFKELGLAIEMKWPNDLFIKGKKIGGILLENVDSTWILGVGININQDAKDVQKIDQEASSYFIETTKNLYVEEAAKVIAKIFIGHLNQLISNGFSPFAHQINEQFLLTGDGLWQNEQDSMIGRILGLDKEGFLLFESNSKTHLLQAGSLKLLHQG
jgi:BirA family biotin operon repressor/biotin-[acetyl-CoA-carboxylase] ligase